MRQRQDNPADQRLVALAQVRQLAVVRDDEGGVTALPHAERAVENCLEAIRRARIARGAAGAKLDMNHVWVHVWPVVEIDSDGLTALGNKIRPLTDGAGIEEVLAQGRVSVRTATPVPVVRALRRPARARAWCPRSRTPPTELLTPLDDYAGKVLRARRRGLVYPYELAPLLTGPEGTLVEHDLDDTGALVPVDRPRGLNKAGIIAARRHHADRRCTPRASPGCVLCGDPTKSLGSVAEPECARIIAALDLAERMQRAGRVVRPVGGRPDLDGLRHREHGLGRRGAAPDRGVHPGRRRDQRRRRRHQRRRPAVLERRGHDAACTPRASW